MNCSKLLNHGPDYAYIRNRQEECVYYTLKFWGPHYALTKTIWRDPDGNASNTFMSGILLAFDPDKTDEEKRTAADAIKPEKTVIRSGWIFSLEKAADELNEISKITPDLEWHNWKKEEEEEDSK